MRRKPAYLLLAAALLLSVYLSACEAKGEKETLITLADSGIKVDGEAASRSAAAAVCTGAELLYYHDGTDSTYGEGTAEEMHPPADAAAHTVVTISRPGTYRVTGTLSKGQLAVDLGEDAKEDPDAVVTLILDNMDITCTVAPAIMFYNVYECGKGEPENSSGKVDTTAAGANVIIAAGSDNKITGSHVARIYKEGTTKKLHKYDGAFYSRMSMNVTGEDDSTSVLNIIGDNEGLDTERHLTISGGVINIKAQNDGINANADDVSVITINGGVLTVNGGLGDEGDGIDSNGYLTINGGTIWTMSHESTKDGGIDAVCDITINDGTLYAFGVKNDPVSGSSRQPFLELSFDSPLPPGSVISIRDPEGKELMSVTTEKKCRSLTYSSQDLKEDVTYLVYVDGVSQSNL